MCTLPPLPQIGLTLPWDAPGVWAVWLAMVGFCGLLFWAMRINRSYGRDPSSRAEWVLGWTGGVLGLVVCGALLLVIFPAENALTRWLFDASILPTCDHDMWFPLWSQQHQALTTVFLATIALTAIVNALFYTTSILTSRRRRRERMQSQAAVRP